MVCEISGEPGVGKSSGVPVELLGLLMEIHQQTDHGIVAVMDLKEAQNTLFEHLNANVRHAQNWVSIWSGDPDGHRWPRQQSFMQLCAPRSLLNKMLDAESTIDAQHLIYDEVRDATSWALFLLSNDLYRLPQGADIKI